MTDAHDRYSLTMGLLNWLSTINAIMEREIKTRFAGGSLGHAWAVIIPVSWIAAITIFFHWMGRSAPISASMPAFLATGMLPYLVFRQTVTSMMRAKNSNRHLLTLGPAKLEDVFTATALLELMNALLISATILGLIAIWIGLPAPQNPLLAIWGLTLACAFGIAFGRFAAVLAIISDSAMRLTPIILRPFFWISGIFFVAAELPGWLLDYLWFNPLLHAIELLRAGFFAGFDSHFANPLVPISATISLYFASRLIEGHIDTRAGLGTRSA